MSMPLIPVGFVGAEGSQWMPFEGTAILDATNEALIIVGQVFTADEGSHTIDTGGSSSLGWLTGAVTFADAGTTVKVGLAAVDLAAGPPARAVHASNVITFDVVASFTGGGGGITGAAWQTSVPTSGTKTIAHGDFVAFAVQMTARGGTDSVRVANSTPIVDVQVRPTITLFTGSYAAPSAATSPNVVITFSDGTLGAFYGSYIFATTAVTQTWNSSSSPNEYGNFLQMPAGRKIYGLFASVNIGGNCDLVLYSDPLGTPVAERTVSFDANAIGIAQTNRRQVGLFTTPYTSTANQPLAVVIKPTTTTNVVALYKTHASAAHQAFDSFGTNGYAISRSSGAFAAINSSKDRFQAGFLLSPDNTSGGGRAILVNNMNVVA